MREAAQIYDVRMTQFVLKIEKLSHIMGPGGSQDLRSPFPIMAPDQTCIAVCYIDKSFLLENTENSKNSHETTFGTRVSFLALLRLV